MNFSNIAIGTDIETNERFKGKLQENNEKFLNRIFTIHEIEYCLSKKNAYVHLCARFCAKEAVIKALADFDISDVFYKDIEILNKENGMPFVNLVKYSNLNIKISLSHCDEYSSAMVIIYK